MSSGSKKELRYACLSETKAANSPGVWAEVSSSAPHLHNGVSDSPIRWRCLLSVLCPVRRPVTALDFVLLGQKPSLDTQTGPEINSRACLWVSPRPRHHTRCWLTNQRLILLLISCLETPKAASGTTNFRAEPPLASMSAISFPRTPACPGNQYSPTSCRVESDWSYHSIHCCVVFNARVGKTGSSLWPQAVTTGKLWRL